MAWKLAWLAPDGLEALRLLTAAQPQGTPHASALELGLRDGLVAAHFEVGLAVFARWPGSLAWHVPDGLEVVVGHNPKEVWPGMCQMAWK